MRSITITAILASSATLLSAAGLAHAVRTASPYAIGTPEVCRGLVDFLREHGGRARGATATITLEEAQRYARESNGFACRSAISGMYTVGVALPVPLLKAIGVPTDAPFGAARR